MTQSAERTEPAPGGRSALLLGATGLVGGYVLAEALAAGYGRVAVLGRRKLAQTDPRVEQHVVEDLGRMAEHAEAFRVDDVFCCLGTTLRAAGSREAFRRVDHDHVLESARLAAEQGAKRYLLVTAMGAEAGSRVFYNRVKGEVEDAVRALPLPYVVVLRPSLILGPRPERRPAEAMAQRVAPALNAVLVGPLRKYRAVEARTVARAMVRLAFEDGAGVRVVES
ncbi:MAG TPA: NAD(P)H-binding protein, partial [Longimicrobium sp.]|nr:NAD(P)H-binding protein [Longimicrobium sp.]